MSFNKVVIGSGHTIHNGSNTNYGKYPTVQLQGSLVTLQEGDQKVVVTIDGYLSDLIDVNYTSLHDGDILSWNAQNGTWQPTDGSSKFSYENSSFTAVSNTIHAVDTSTSSITATLPANPANFTAISFYDINSTFSNNPLTILTIDGSFILNNSQLILDNSNSSIQLVYYDNNWSLYGSGVPNSPLSSKGDILTHTGSELTTLPVGVDGTFLIADSSSLSGLSWKSISSIQLDASTLNSQSPSYYLDLSNHTGTLPSTSITGLATVATSGSYNDLLNSPTLATVATSGSYNDLLNSPTLATVATSGSYNDLLNTPTLGTAALYNVGLNANNIVQLDTNGQIPSSLISGSASLPLTTKGDIVVRDETDLARLEVGTNNQVLLADSTAPLGLRWGDLVIYSVVNISFTQPAVGSTVEITISTSTWMTRGLYIHIDTGGVYEIMEINSPTTIVIKNLYQDNTEPGQTINLARKITLAARRGQDGNNAYTTTTSTFIMPNEGANVTVSVVYTSWVSVGQYIFIKEAGYFEVISKTIDSLTVKNLGYPINAVSGTSITSPKDITTVGLNGLNSFGVIEAGFTMPAINNTVTVNVDNNSWVAVGQNVYVETAGSFTVVSKPSHQLTLRNDGSSQNATQGVVISSGVIVTASGLIGQTGASATSTTASNFTQPAIGSNVTVTVGSTVGFAEGAYIYIPTGGFYKVMTIASTTSLTIQNIGDNENATQGTVISSGLKVISSGRPGIDGINGIDGEDGISLDWLGTRATPPLTPVLNQAYYDSTDKKSYIWDGATWNIIAQDGEDGSIIRWLGAFLTAPTDPNKNEIYYNITDRKTYIWTGTSWEIVSQDSSSGVNAQINFAHQSSNLPGEVNTLVLFSKSTGLFFTQPNNTVTQVGDMLKSVYDTNNNGIIDQAAAISGSPSANQYYGTNGAGAKGFYNLPSSGSLSSVTDGSTTVNNVTGIDFNGLKVTQNGTVAEVSIDYEVVINMGNWTP